MIKDRDLPTSIKRRLLKTRNDAAGARLLKREFANQDPPELVSLVLALADNLDRYTLGYLVFPSLRERARTERAVTAELQACLLNKRGAFTTRLLILDLLDHLARLRRGRYSAQES